MNPLIRKDVREHSRCTVLGFAIFVLVILFGIHAGRDLLHRFAFSKISAEIHPLQPLLSSGFLIGASIYCAVFGAALGWFQTRSEAHRDLWAFLIHRPMTRTGIFRGKVLAGLILYVLGAGIPAALMVCAVAMPGVTGAPFELAMALPLLAIFFTGIAYYFAGMLTALRQARWFGSRIFGLGGALVASLVVNMIESFWQAMAVTMVSTALIAVAAWGAYQSGGYYRGQPRAGKIALTLSVTGGSVWVLLVVGALLAFFFDRNGDYRYQQYVLNADGEVLIATSHEGSESYSHLDGKPFLNLTNNQPMTAAEFNTAHRVLSYSAFATGRGIFDRTESYNSVAKFFSLWAVSQKNLWYLDRHGKLVGFSGFNRQPIGEIVPQGATGAEVFMRNDSWGGYEYYSSYNSHPSILATADTLYRVQLDDRKLTPILNADPGDPFIGYSQNNNSGQPVLVLSRNNVRLINTQGKTLASVPYLPDAGTYPQIEVSFLRTVGGYVIWFFPDYMMNSKSGNKMPVKLLWVSSDNKVTQTRDLATLQTPGVESFSDKLAAFLAPVPLQLVIPDEGKSRSFLFLISSVGALLVAVMFLRRYRFSTGAVVAWLLFIALTGIPGLITFFCVQEWPRREVCPVCKKLRTVDHEHCEHCAAAFPPPPKIGIEIFEPLAAPKV